MGEAVHDGTVGLETSGRGRRRGRRGRGWAALAALERDRRADDRRWARHRDLLVQYGTGRVQRGRATDPALHDARGSGCGDSDGGRRTVHGGRGDGAGRRRPADRHLAAGDQAARPGRRADRIVSPRDSRRRHQSAGRRTGAADVHSSVVSGLDHQLSSPLADPHTVGRAATGTAATAVPGRTGTPRPGRFQRVARLRRKRRRGPHPFPDEVIRNSSEVAGCGQVTDSPPVRGAGCFAAVIPSTLMERNLTPEQLELFEKEFASRPQYRVMQNAVTETPVAKIALDRQVVTSIDHSVSNLLDDWKVTNQKKSGRCWLFA